MKAAAIALAAALIWGAAVSGARADYQSHGKRDPFVRLITLDGRRIHPPSTEDRSPGGNSGGFVLQGIVTEQGPGAVAVINQRVFREGDEFEGMKVLKIEPKSVTIQFQGESQRLVMPSSEEENAQP